MTEVTVTLQLDEVKGSVDVEDALGDLVGERLTDENGRVAEVFSATLA
jgi:hypothetical protein